MNCEQAYIKVNNPDKIIELVYQRLNGNLRHLRYDEDLNDIPNSFSDEIANDLKRKIAISKPIGEWIEMIEAREINDYALLIEISKVLNTDVFVIMQYDSVGAWGFADISNGEVTNSYFSEDDDDVEGLIEAEMNRRNIGFPTLLFRETFSRNEMEWKYVQKEK